MRWDFNFALILCVCVWGGGVKPALLIPEHRRMVSGGDVIDGLFINTSIFNPNAVKNTTQSRLGRCMRLLIASSSRRRTLGTISDSKVML